MKRLSLLILIGLFVVASSGCYQRTIAPELTYDATQVDILDREIENLEWD